MNGTLNAVTMGHVTKAHTRVNALTATVAINVTYILVSVLCEKTRPSMSALIIHGLHVVYISTIYFLLFKQC